jgi:steroid delta-isomerase-like uncharacterized protein
VLAGDPRSDGGWRVLFYSGNDSAAKAEVAALIDRIGFVGIDLGSLAVGGRLAQFPGGPLPNQNSSRSPDGPRIGSSRRAARTEKTMKKYLLIAAGLILYLPVHGQERSIVMNDVTIWYDAFNNRDAALAQKVMSEDWIDIPAAPGQPPGRKGVEFILDDLSKAFPDFRITPVEILQDGNKVVVRSELTGTQRAPFMGFPAKNRTMTIQTIDIHEFNDGKIIRTWHSEDWLTALHQLGAFEK